MPTDAIYMDIREKLRRLSHTSNEHCIFKVDDHVRSHNERAYIPRVISIGPYHHGKYDLDKMEMYKARYLQELLHRKNESVDTYISALRSLEHDPRKCYAEDQSHIPDRYFVEMMCLDGCFVIEFLRKHHKRSGDDSISQKGWLVNSIYRDLLLFENQIPFFILNKLFEMTKTGGEDGIIKLGLDLCLMNGFRPTKDFATQISAVSHLLDLVYKGWCSSFDITNRPNFSLEYIKSATELRKSGVKIRSARQYESWLHITFTDGIIEIPTLTVNDFTESLLRNLIAYELYMSNPSSWSYVTDYVTFLDLLIDSPRDVEQLRRHEVIIVNLLGDKLRDDKAVSTMFNKLLPDILVNDRMFYYWRVCEEVNKYCSRRCNRWRGQCVFWLDQLTKNYFSSPWSIISVLAAVVLLILTAVQTIFSILAVNKGT